MDGYKNLQELLSKLDTALHAAPPSKEAAAAMGTGGGAAKASTSAGRGPRGGLAEPLVGSPEQRLALAHFVFAAACNASSFTVAMQCLACIKTFGSQVKIAASALGSVSPATFGMWRMPSSGARWPRRKKSLQFAI